MVSCGRERMNLSTSNSSSVPRAMTEDSLSQEDHPFYGCDAELLITRDQQVTGKLPCQRLLLPRFQRWPTHHIAGHLARDAGGLLHALISGSQITQHWISPDSGLSWHERPTDLAATGAFTILTGGLMLNAGGGGDEPIRIHASADGGDSWQPTGTIEAGVFDGLHVDSNLLELRDGTVLLAANMRLAAAPGEPLLAGHFPQYVYRSVDQGVTWTGGDPAYWRAVARQETEPNYAGPEYSPGGPGGTFDGVYETGFCELSNGLLLGAFRLSGPPRSWHKQIIASWGEPPDAPDAHGRLFRHVVLGESPDGGITWGNLRPVLDAWGRPLMAHGESNGELLQVPDGRVVLVHQTRYAEAPERAQGLYRGRSQLCARVSEDAGRTWLPQRYRLIFGFGYSSTLALDDGAIITATGASLGDNGDPRRAAVMRWQLAD
jgi:hypothetical protein